MSTPQIRSLTPIRPWRPDGGGCLAALIFPLLCVGVVWRNVPPAPSVAVAWGDGGRLVVAEPGRGTIRRYVLDAGGGSDWRRWGDRLLRCEDGAAGLRIIEPDGRQRRLPVSARYARDAYPLGDSVVCSGSSDGAMVDHGDRVESLPGIKAIEVEPGGRRWARLADDRWLTVCTGPPTAPTSSRQVHRLSDTWHWCYDWRHDEVVWEHQDRVLSAASPGQQPRLRFRLSTSNVWSLATDEHTGDLLAVCGSYGMGYMVSIPYDSTKPRWRRQCDRGAAPIGEWRPADERLLRDFTAK